MVKSKIQKWSYRDDDDVTNYVNYKKKEKIQDIFSALKVKVTYKLNIYIYIYIYKCIYIYINIYIYIYIYI